MKWSGGEGEDVPLYSNAGNSNMSVFLPFTCRLEDGERKGGYVYVCVFPG